MSETAAVEGSGRSARLSHGQRLARGVEILALGALPLVQQAERHGALGKQRAKRQNHQQRVPGAGEGQGGGAAGEKEGRRRCGEAWLTN